MSYDAEQVKEIAENIADLVGTNFLQAAHWLRRAQDEYPELFLEIVRLSGLHTRRAYYFVEIDRKFSQLKVDHDRLRKIGWTKLQILSSQIDEENCEALLDFAETHSAYELKQLMDGGTPDPDARCVLLYLTPDQYEIFQLAIMAYGGVKSTRGLGDKEAALTTALTKLLSISHSG